MIDLHSMMGGAVGAAAITVGWWGVGKFGPSYVAGKFKMGFDLAKSSPWWRDAAHPKRAKWLMATVELLEEEIPEPGHDLEIYDRFGRAAAARFPFGSAERWAETARKFGDALDTELDDEIKNLASEPPKP